MAQSVGHLTSAQVMISQFMSSSPVSGCVDSLETVGKDNVVGFLVCTTKFVMDPTAINFVQNKKLKAAQVTINRKTA